MVDVESSRQVAKYALSTIDGTLSDKPTGLSRLLLGYSPHFIQKFIIRGRLRLNRLKLYEKKLGGLEKAILYLSDEINKEISNDDYNIDRRIKLEKLEKEYRILSTVIQALEYVTVEDELTEDEEPPLLENQSSQTLWWDLFEDLASRRNEPWRIELFAKSLALNDQEPNAISLKALWEIAMMETNDFGALKIFLDSSVYLDGKAFVLMEPEEQYSFEPDVNEFQSGNLALCITGLIDKGLVQLATTQIMTTDPVKIEHQSGTSFLLHEMENLSDKEETAVRIEGYSATDNCLDICKLYSPEFNIASEHNFEILKELFSNDVEYEPGTHKSNYSFKTEKRTV